MMIIFLSVFNVKLIINSINQLFNQLITKSNYWKLTVATNVYNVQKHINSPCICMFLARKISKQWKINNNWIITHVYFGLKEIYYIYCLMLL